MADTNETFSSLDSLGPAYGKINQPSLDEQGLSPFEGERLSMPEINFPEPKAFVPVVPSAASLDNQQTTVRNQIVGRPPQKQPSGSKLGAQDFAKAIGDYYSAKAGADQDKNEYARIYSYDATPSGNAFYKRYAASGQETFDKLGFHPFRDNEAIYNAGTSGWADAKRMMTHSFWPMFSNAFVSGPKSLLKMAQGDFSPDKESAALSEEQSAIGYSSRGGFGSFMNNTAMSFAYTAGIITEALVEEGAAMALTAATGGGAAPALFAVTANNLRKVPSILKGVNAVDNAVDGMKAMNATLKGLNAPSTARSFWNASRVEKGLTSPVAKFFNPLQNLSEAGFKIAKNEDNLTGLARVYDATSKTFGGFYGDVRAINMALSEARLEGGFSENEVYNQLYDEYYRENGTAPDDKTQEKMMLTAKEAGMNSVMWNTALIYGSNKIVLDNIVHRNGGPKNFLRSKTEDLLNLEGGTILKKTKSTTLKTGKTFKTPTLEWRQRNLWNTVKGFAERPLSKSIPAGISYFKANIGEALQENAQEVISDATKNYYIDSYSNPNVATHTYARGLVSNAIKDQFSAKGFETFSSGFVMGMFASPLNAVPKAFSIGYNKIFDKEGYQKYKTARDKYGKQMVDKLSSVDLKDFFDNNLRNYGAQASAADVRMNAGEKASRDAADAAFIVQMDSVLEKNMMPYYIEQLQSLQQLTAEEFEEVVPTIPQGKGQEYLDKIPDTIARAKRMENKYNTINKRFPNPVNISNYKKDDPDYEDASLTYHAWEQGKRNAIFFSESFDNVTERMSSIINDVTNNGPLKKAQFNDMKVLFDQAALQNETEILKTEIDTLEATGGDKKELNKKKRKLEALNSLNEGIGNYKKYFVDRNQLVQRILDQNKDASEEQIFRMINQELGERTDDNDIRSNDALEATFKDYLKALASVSDDYLFDSDVDSAFEKLRDFYLLSKESQAMVEGINLLHDPKGFLDHVQRNKVWMKELYDNRREYYENLKEQEFQKKEGNDLLNQLASQGLYISLDDYERWRDMGILPDEVYDDVNKVVIRRSNPRYDDLMRPFQMLSDLKAQRGEVEITEEAIKDDLERLEIETQSRLDALPREDKRTDLGPLDFGTKSSLNIKNISNQLADSEYAEVISDQGNEYVFYKDGDTLRLTDAEGDEVVAEILNDGAKPKFVQASKYKLTSEPDPDAVKEIMDSYNEKKAEILQRASEKGVENPGAVAEKVIYSTDMSIEDFPQDLHNAIVMAFEEFAEQEGMSDLVGDDYDLALDSFMKSNLVAARIIDDYNKDQELGKAVEGAGDYEPTITIGDKSFKMSELSESELKGYLKTFQLERDALDEEEPSPEVDVKKARLDYSIKAINKVLTGKVSAGYSAPQKKTIDKIQKIIDFQDNVLKGKNGYVINNQLMKRVTQVIRQFETEDYKYSAENDVKATFNTTIADQGFNEESISNFISELRKQRLPGFSEFTYKELQNELNTMLAESPSSNNEELLNKVMNTIAEKTYEESRVSGNYIDDQVRNLFADKQPVFDESKISQEAFDNLFNEDPENPGYLTKVKKLVDEEGLYVLSRVILKDGTERGLVVYDEDAGVAGEVDLLAVDRNGKVFIIDVKTGKEVKWRGFNTENNQSSKKEIYTLQQTAYANLLFNLTDEQAKVSLLPVQVDYESETGRITRAGRPTPKGALAEGAFRIPLDISDDIQAKINSVIPRKAVAVEQPEVEPSEDFDTSMEEESMPESKPAPGTPMDKFKAAIKDATQEQVDSFKKEIGIAAAKNLISAGDIMQIQELINQRQRELDNNIEVKLTPSNVKVGDQLVALNTIFVNDKAVISEGDIVTIKSIEDVAQFASVNTMTTPSVETTFSFAELNKMFKLKEEVMETKDVDVQSAPLTKQEKNFVDDSFENVNELLKSSTKKDALKKEAGTQSTDEVDTQLFEDVTSDC